MQQLIENKSSLGLFFFTDFLNMLSSFNTLNIFTLKVAESTFHFQHFQSLSNVSDDDFVKTLKVAEEVLSVTSPGKSLTRQLHCNTLSPMYFSLYSTGCMYVCHVCHCTYVNVCHCM